MTESDINKIKQLGFKPDVVLPDADAFARLDVKADPVHRPHPVELAGNQVAQPSKRAAVVLEDLEVLFQIRDGDDWVAHSECLREE